jgi:8-oxo-dGTP diphosphatase
MPRPNDVGVGVAIIVIDDEDQVLLGLRKGAHAAGLWSAPGGWVDRTDTDLKETCQRELLEEVGLKVSQSELYSLEATIEQHSDLNIACITCYYFMDLDPKLKQNVKLMEPHKCERWEWFNADDLPENLFPNLKTKILELIS